MKTLKKTAIFLALCVTACTLLLCACSGSVGKKTIDLDKYVVITYDGYDGYGQAYARLDTDALQADYGDKLSLNTNNSMAMWYQGESVASIISTFAGCWMEQYEGLSNGDETDLVWNVDNSAIEELLGCSVSYSSSAYTVEGLEEVGIVNVFDGVTVNFTGVSPLGEAEIIADNQFGTDSWASSFSYTLSQNSNLSNGDNVTISFDISDMNAFINEFGAMPENTTAEATVSGLDSYVTDISQLSSEDITALESEAMDQFQASLVNAWVNIGDTSEYMGGVHGVCGDDYTLDSIYFYLSKNGQDNAFLPLTSISFVYSVSAGTDGDYYGRTYRVVSYDNLIKEENGNMVGISDVGISNSYGTIDAVYKEFVTAKKDDYSITAYDEKLNVIE